MHENQNLVGDIHPKNIFINNIGDIALFNLYTFPEEYTNYEKVLFYNEVTYLGKFEYYLAP